MQWLGSSGPESLTRRRIAVAIVSAIAAASVAYCAYYARSPRAGRSSQGLHRSNAIRRPRGPRRRTRQNSTASSTGTESHDENLDLSAIRPLNDGETVVDGQTAEWWDDSQLHQSQPRAGYHIVTLLFRVSEDSARRNAIVHRGCQCNSCSMVPIRGTRYRCANCADFDLCEACESQNIHTKTHIFYKIRIPAPPFCPRQMQPVWYTGDPETCLRQLSKVLINKLSRETGFERPELEAFWEQWTFMANTEWREDPDELFLAMDRKTFDRCLVPSGGSRHAAPNLIHDRMFAFYDTNHDDLIGFTEFLHGLAYRKRKDKLRRIFDGYDIDGDGYVNRRDFLRMFRAYYVLYKQMHKDILEGLDDQLMSSTEAQQLVNSRQPLSSIFGREGRVPIAEIGARVESKLHHANGDVELRDGRNGVVREDKGDTASREEILTSLFASRAENPLSEEVNADIHAVYLDSILYPPTDIDELPGLLTGEPRPFTRALAGMDEDEDEDKYSSDEEHGSNTENEPGPSTRATTATSAGDAPQPNGERLVNPEQFTGSMPTESQVRAHVFTHSQRSAPEVEKRRRIAARKRLHERWKRRQFYLDEEEGGMPPEGWEADEDVMLGVNGFGESSKSAQRPLLSPRSRSSSKVRFAEDADEYETRSNHSASSRSVPERWGGMDIPDAERDAGKEILYQVTQQAFNELLDVIFKDKEDLAISANETKDARKKNRDILSTVVLTEAEMKADFESGNTDEAPESPVNPSFDASHRIFADEDRAAEEREAAEREATKESEGDEAVNEGRELTELLDEIGGAPNEQDDGKAVEIETVDELDEIDEVDEILPKQDQMRLESINNLDFWHVMGKEAVADEEEKEKEIRENVDEYRDPTMPQFRPNSEAISDLEVPATAQTNGAVSSSKGKDKVPGVRTNDPPRDQGDETGSPKGKLAENIGPGRKKLVEWKKLDMAEEEAWKRGGWGMLSFAEFEAIYKKQEMLGNRLEYLGSWIDFCIP